MYEILEEKRDWSTSLFYCDPESCILSHILPCHVYARIHKECYLFHFLYYGIFCISIYNFYYWINYVNTNRCIGSVTDECIGLSDKCNNHYMLINGVPSNCIINQFNFCTYNEISCYKDYKNLNFTISFFGSISYFILFFLNFFLREKVKKENNIERHLCYDAGATLCSTCGLAQEYREVEGNYINV